jgi:hypothetical protein
VRIQHRWWGRVDALATREALAVDLAVSEARYAANWPTWCRYMNNALAFHITNDAELDARDLAADREAKAVDFSRGDKEWGL